MKIIKYNLCTTVNMGTDEEPDIQEVLSAVTMDWSEANEEIAKREAHNGEYTIEDDTLIIENDVIVEGGEPLVWKKVTE
jgi:hypothetical protein